MPIAPINITIMAMIILLRVKILAQLHKSVAI